MNARWRVTLLAAASFALVTACGTAQNGNKVASLSSPSATPTSAQQASNGRSDEDKIRDFTKCMRDHGVDIPEPTSAPKGGSTGGGKGGVGIMVQGNGPDKEKIDKANEACRPLLPNGGAPPKLDAQQLDEMRKMAQCMREHGVNVPDPDPNNPGIMTQDQQGQIDPQKMEAASKACAPAGAEIHTQQGPDGGGGAKGPEINSGNSTGGSK
jgi:hypothetical protein